MKTLSYLLVILLLLQSCNVYNTPSTVEAAVVAEKKTRLINTHNKKFDFLRLEIDHDRLIGVTKRKSSTARKLVGMPIVIDGQYLRINLSNFDIESISLRNDSHSSLLTLAIVVGSLAAFYVVTLILEDELAAAAMASIFN